MDQSVNMVFPCLIDLKNILPPSKGKPTSIYPIGGHQYRKTPTHWLRLQGTDGLGSSKYTNSSPGPYPSDQIAAKLGNQSPFPTTLGIFQAQSFQAVESALFYTESRQTNPSLSNLVQIKVPLATPISLQFQVSYLALRVQVGRILSN